jgi:hypothetical protein
MFRKMLIIATALVALAAAPASATYDVAVNPGSVVPGGTVTVTGGGCEPYVTVQVTFTPHGDEASDNGTALPPDAVVVATGTTDAEGEYAVEFVVPTGTAAGTYDVDVYCDGLRVGGETVEVAGANVATTQPGGGTGDGNLVRTGSDLNGLGLLGAGLLVAGGIALIATRSRRHLHG